MIRTNIVFTTFHLSFSLYVPWQFLSPFQLTSVSRHMRKFAYHNIFMSLLRTSFMAMNWSFLRPRFFLFPIFVSAHWEYFPWYTWMRWVFHVICFYYLFRILSKPGLVISMTMNFAPYRTMSSYLFYLNKSSYFQLNVSLAVGLSTT